MCGIVGMILKHNSGPMLKHEGALYDALYADAVRGFDATGMIGVEKDTTFHIAKEAAEATYFISGWKGLAMSREMFARGKAYIGHNRKKTSGSYEDEHAHPFVVNKTFAMVHNGSLYDHKQLADVDMDSKALAIVLQSAFADSKPKEALEETLGRVRGAYAVACYDQTKHNIHLFRNVERPLGLIETPDAWYFASECMMLQWCLVREGRYKMDELTYKPINEHELFTFNLDTSKMTQEVLTVKKSTALFVTHHGSAQQGQKKTNEHHGKSFTASNKAYTTKDIKSFRKTWLGKKVRFDVDDIVECNYPSTFANGEGEAMLFGVSNMLQFNHSVFANIDIKQLGLPGDEDVLKSHQWMGTVASIEFGKNQSYTLYVTLDEVRPILKSIDTKKKYAEHPSDEEHQRWDDKLNELSDRELLNFLRDNQGLYMWQLKAVYDEQRTRAAADKISKVIHEGTTSIH